MVSIVWKDIAPYFPLVGNWLFWKVGNKLNFRIGENLWIGYGEVYRDLGDMIDKI